MSANYRESFIERDYNEAVRMPPPAMMEDLKKNLITEFEVTEAPVAVVPPPQPQNKPVTHTPGYMNVYLKVRPFSDDEYKNNEDQKCFQDRGNNTVAMHAPKDSKTFKNVAHGQGKATHSFTFSNVFGQRTTQKEFFGGCTLPIVKDFINGQNCLMFTYGVTSAGKTYTLLGSPDNAGILPRSLDVVFNSISGRHISQSNLMPRLFREVVSMTPKTSCLQQKIKDKVMRMATDNEPNMSVLLGADAETSRLTDASTCYPNSMFSMDSQSSTQSGDSLKSLQPDPSLPSICEGEAVDYKSMERTEQMLSEADNRIREETRLSVDLAAELKFAIWVSFAEIYNENIYDLLEPLPTKKNSRRVVLRLKEDEKGIPFIKGLKWILVADGDEAFKILTIGRRNLQVACTNLNKSSSRSHCIFSMKMIRTADTNAPHMARVNMLSFVDLAGSERYSKTKNEGTKLREAAYINTSLLTLGRCLDTLRFNQHHKMSQKMVPFRESRLTRLFQSFFTGEGKAAMIVNINQNASMFDETLHALKFSAIAKQVTVVQKPEPEKKPLPPPAKPPLKNRKKKSSLPKEVRESVAWASPRTLQKYMEMEEAEDNDDDEDVTMQYDIEELLSTIDNLTLKLREEKMQAALNELKIREEVSEEMSKYIVKIETEYSERMEESRAFEEERADQRIDLYINTIKKRKRKRGDVGEESPCQSALEIQNKELKAKVEELDDELADARTDVAKAMSERDAMREKLSEVNFELAGVKELTTESESKISDTELIDDLGRRLEESQERLRQQSEQIYELNELLSEAGQTFQDKDLESERLKATIMDDERQLKEQTETILDLRKMVVEARNNIEQLESKQNSADKTISQREMVVKEQEKIIKRLEMDKNETGNKLRLLESSKGQGQPLDPNMSTVYNVSVAQTFDETVNFELRERMMQLEEDVDERRTDANKLEEMKCSLLSIQQDLEKSNRDLIAQLEMSTKQLELVSEEKSHLAVEVHSLHGKIHQLQLVKENETKVKAKAERNNERNLLLAEDLASKKTEINNCEKLSSKLKNEIENLEKRRLSKKLEFETLVEEFGAKEIEMKNSEISCDKMMKKLEFLNSEITERKSELESLVKVVSKHQNDSKSLSDVRKELENLRVELKEKTVEVDTKTTELNDLKAKLELKKSVNQKYYEKMCSLEEDLDSVKTAFEKLEDENDDLLTEKKALEEVATQLSTQITEAQDQLEAMAEDMSQLENQLRSVECEKSLCADKMKSLETDASMLITEKSRLEAETSRLLAEFSKLQEEKQQLAEETTRIGEEKSRIQEEKSLIEREISRFEKEAEKLTSRTGELYSMLKVANDIEVKLKSEKNEKSARIMELESSLEELDTELSRESQDRSRLEEEVLVLRKKLLELEIPHIETFPAAAQTTSVKFFTEDLENELKGALKERDELREESDELRGERDELREEKYSWKIQKDLLENEKLSMSNAQIQLEEEKYSLNEKVNLQTEKITELNIQVAEVMKEKDSLNEMVNLLTEKIKELDIQVAEVMKEKEEFLKENDSLKLLKENLECEKSTLFEEINKLKEDMQISITQIREESKVSKDKEDSLNKEIAQLTEERNVLKSTENEELSQLREENTELKERKDSLIKKLTDKLTTVTKELKELKEEEDSLRLQKELLESEKLALVEENKEWQEAADSSDKKTDDLTVKYEKLENELKQTVIETDELRQECDGLKAEKQLLESEKMDLKQENIGVTEKKECELEENEEKLNTELSVLNTELQESLTREGELRAEMTTMTEHCTILEAQRNQLLKSVLSVKSQWTTISARLLRRDDTDVKLGERMDRLVVHDKNLRTKLHDSQRENQRLKMDIAYLDSQVDSKTESLRKLSSDLEESEGAASLSDQNKLKELIKEKEELIKKLRTDEKELEKSQKLVDELKNALTESDQVQSQQEEYNNTLETDITNLKQKVKTLEGRLLKHEDRESVKSMETPSGRGTRLRLWPKENSACHSPSLPITAPSVKREEDEEEIENIDPQTSELLCRGVQAEFITPSPPQSPLAKTPRPMSGEKPSHAKTPFSMNAEKEKSSVISPDRLAVPLPTCVMSSTRPVRSSARKAKQLQSSLSTGVKSEARGERSSRSRKRVLMQETPIYDISPDNSLESQTLIDKTEETPVEESVRRRLRTRRK